MSSECPRHEDILSVIIFSLSLSAVPSIVLPSSLLLFMSICICLDIPATIDGRGQFADDVGLHLNAHSMAIVCCRTFEVTMAHKTCWNVCLIASVFI